MRRLFAVLAAAALLAPAAARADAVRPFGTLSCTPRDGVRSCPGSVDTRVPSFDGVPLDVDVTLPARGDTGLPLVVLLHGWGGSKVGFADARPWAQAGYAVLSYTARGFGDSCGSLSSRLQDPAGCARGWVHLADSRYEARDTQQLAGMLADEGLVDPQRIGVTGGSYGGGQSLELAMLRDRVRLSDGTLVPWRSPGRHLAMRLAPAAPGLAGADARRDLLPNGHTRDDRVTGPTDDLSPIGVEKLSFVSGLFASGLESGYYAPPLADPGADLVTWYALVSGGDPYDENPLAASVVKEIARNHSAYYLPYDEPAAPTLIANGFTDDLFPVDEALRWVAKERAEHPGTPLAEMYFDFGHMRGQNKAADAARLDARIHEWFDRYVKGDGGSVLHGVEALTQTCPASAPSGGPFLASSWAAIHPGLVRLASSPAQSVLSLSGSPLVARAIDPVAGDGACATTDAADQAGTATYRFPVAGGGYTLLGAPAVIADLAVTGVHQAIAARLWDVAPDGATQTLVARAVYRPAGSGRQVFQLHPNGWRFEPGHTVKLELLGQDTPYARIQNLPGAIGVANLELRLPVHERPTAGTPVGPAAPLPGA